MIMRYLIPIESRLLFRRRGIIGSLVSSVMSSFLSQISLLPLKILYAQTLDFLPVVVMPFFPPLHAFLLMILGVVLFLQSSFNIVPTVCVSFIKESLHILLVLNHHIFTTLNILNISHNESGVCIFFIFYVLILAVLLSLKRQPKHSYRIY